MKKLLLHRANIRHFLNIFHVVLVSLFSGYVAAASVDLSDFDLVFSDEFNSDALDSNKWSTRHLWGSFNPINSEEQYYVDSLDFDQTYSFSPFTLTGTTLKIQAVETTTNLQAPDQPAESSDHWTSNPDFQYNSSYNPGNRKYLSGIISSVENFNFTHGYVSMRAKVPAGKGLWSAFWLLTSKYVEDVPEIDIMESLGEFENEVNHTMHYFDVSNNWELISTPTYKTSGTNYTDSFHEYSVLWEPNKITWLVDGETVKEITEEEFLIPKQSMYIIANLAVGGTWPGSPDSTTSFPANYEIDYIRAYKRKPIESISPQSLNEEYDLMFSDEFSGNSLDITKWTTSYLWGPFFNINNEQQYYVDILSRDSDYTVNPYELSDGTLKLNANKIEPENLPIQPNINDPIWQLFPSHQYNNAYQQTNGWKPKYTSGLITSYDSFKFVHGYVEARIRVPEGSGLWPAFWLLNGYYVGPQPEIDIMELRGEEPDIAHHSYHYYNDQGLLQSSAETSLVNGGDSYADEFHTFGVQWDRGTITWYVDGVITRVLSGSETSTQLMYIIANLAVGGNFVGDVGSDVTPAKMEIDYIRAYQRKSTTITQPDIEPPVIEITSIDVEEINLQTIEGVANDDSAAAISTIQYLVRSLESYNFLNDSGDVIGWDPQLASTYLTDNDYLGWTKQLALEDGDYRFYARAIDAAGNMSAWSYTDFNVPLISLDITPPVLSFSTLSNTLSSNPSFTGTWTDDSELAYSTYQLRRLSDYAYINSYGDVEGWNPSIIEDLNLTTGTWSLATSLQQGDYRLLMKGVDIADNVSSWQHKDFTVESLDNQQPIISFSTPATNDALVTGPIAGSVSDDSEIVTAVYLLRSIPDFNFVNTKGEIVSWSPGALQLNETQTSLKTWSIQHSLTEGKYRVYLKFVDIHGNTTGWAYQDFSVENAFDEEPASIEFTSPSQNNNTITSDSVLVGSVNDTSLANVQFLLRNLTDYSFVDSNGVPNIWSPASVDSLESDGSSSEWRINITDLLTNQTYRLYVRVITSAGAIGEWTYIDLLVQ